MKTWLLPPAALALLTIPGFTLADEIDYFSGTISGGAMFIDSGNNLNPEGSEKRLDSLDSAAKLKSTTRAVLLPRATWDVGEPEGLKLYLMTDPPIDEAGGFAINVGGSYTLESLGILDGAAFFTPFQKVWKDPYVTGEDRAETDTNIYGLRVGLNRVLGSGGRVQLVYLNEDVDDDIIGELMPELARDGAVYSLNMNYSYYLSKSFELRPRFSVRRGEYDGDANSFVKYKVEIEAQYRVGRAMLSARTYYSHSDYDEIDPIFAQTRKNDSYGANFMATYMAPFNFTDWSLTALLAISEGDANIDFYDTEARTFGALVNYHF